MTNPNPTIIATVRLADNEVTLEIPADGTPIWEAKQFGVVINKVNLTGHVTPLVELDQDWMPGEDDDPDDHPVKFTSFRLFGDEVEVPDRPAFPNVLGWQSAGPVNLLRDMATVLAANWRKEWDALLDENMHLEAERQNSVDDIAPDHQEEEEAYS